MMKIESLEVQYFLGFGECQKINFDDANVIGIVGTYEGADDKSNRAGKSSLLEAILYNLYGKSRAKKESDVVNWNYKDSDMYTKAVYDFDGKCVEIVRGRTAGNDLILEVSGLEGERKNDVQVEINNMVGIDYEDFIKLNYFMQDDIHNFVKSGSTEMSKLLSKWINTDYWDKPRKRADALIKQAETEIRELQAYNKANNVTLESLQNASESKKKVEGHIDILKEELKNLKAIEADRKDAENADKERYDVEREISKLTKRIEKRKSDTEGIQKEWDAILMNQKKAKKLQKQMKGAMYTKKDLKAIGDKIGELNSKIFSAETILGDLIERKGTLEKGNLICPYTENNCGYLKGGNQAKAISHYNEEYAKLSVELQGYKAQIPFLEQKQYEIEQNLEDNRKLELRIANLDIDDSGYEEHIEGNEEEIKEMESDLKKLKKKLKVIFSKIEKYEDNISIQECSPEEFERTEEEIEEQTKLAGEYAKEIKDGNQKRKTVKKNKARIAELQKKLKHLKFCSFMFGKRGIPNNQIEGAYAEVEADANYILKSKFKTDIQIEFRSYKELQEKETICSGCGFVFPKGYRKTECEECGTVRGKKRRDELNLKMFVGTNEADFDSDSGAGKVMVSLAIRIALIRMLRRRAGIGCSLLFFDEIFAPLDAVNRRNTMNLIFDTLQNEFDFNMIFCISHHEDVSRSIQKNILVTKYNKFSKFEWM